ncbi:MAG: dihydroorotate dehydrogenase electron transfer subunit [Sporomusaceae bacterium]|nr:dihydroorotate dehydrogenase electron transfer subunit [Sporomusaceae bacterium]
MSKRDVLAQVLTNENLTPDGLVKKMTLTAPELASSARPGQFVHLQVAQNSQPLLRRPFSIANAAGDTLTLIYRVVGVGTKLLAEAKPGALFPCMGTLGNGFQITGERPLLIGGGMGLAPLLFLAAKLNSPTVILGGKTASELFWTDLYSGLTKNMHLATDDGSIGTKGFAAALLPQVLAAEKNDIIYACGPQPMLQAVAAIAQKSGIACQVSLEEHMACGVGACLSCTCADIVGNRRKICADGPVFDAREVVL